MVTIENEQRPDVLRQIALLLDQENRRLHERLKNLTIQHGKLAGTDAAALQQELDQIQELLAQRERTIFGASSEKQSKPRQSEPSRAPSKGHGPTPQPLLPVVEETLELADGHRQCPCCDGILEPLGDQTEDSEEITVVQRRFYMVKRRRQKYRCRCNGAVVTTPAPAKLIPGGRYSTEFAVEVAISKYLDHAPLERQSRAMEREGLRVSSQTLWDQIEALARVLEPTYQALQPRVLSAPVVHADETHWRLMSRKGSSRWWVWSISTPETVFYRVCGTRSTKDARKMLSGYRGVVMCDGYSAYKTLSSAENQTTPARDGPRMRLAHCWAHARRKFVEAQSSYPEHCEQALDLIGKLFVLERKVPADGYPEMPELLERRQELRTEKSKPLVGALKSWAENVRCTLLPRSDIGKAVNYMLNHWRGLTLFLDDARIPLSNNHAERELRGVVLGRKNHYGSRSKRGTEVAAILYSLTETAKLVGTDPYAYLLKAAKAALVKPGTVTLPADLS